MDVADGPVMTKGQMLLLGGAAVIVGVVYVLVHEKRRKEKRKKKEDRDKPISKEALLAILNESASASKTLVEQLRQGVRAAQKERKLTDEQAMQLFQQQFEQSLDQVIGAIRQKHGVSEKAMDSAFRQHQEDPAVQEAIANMRMMSAPQAQATKTVSIPADLTKAKLKEIMTFNHSCLEKELEPIKAEIQKAKKSGKQPEVDGSQLLALQIRISEQVKAKFGVDDEQVMAAVDKFNAKNDPAFQDILAKIAETLNTSLQGAGM